MNNVRRLKLGVVLALAAMAAGAVFASSAVAFPTKTSPCSGCHDGVNVPVTATLKSVTAAAATYSVSAPSADAIAVFSGSTRLFVFSATSAQFSVAPGKTYSIQAVAGPGTSDGWGSTSVSPVAPVTDTTAPVTTSDAKATYVSSAAIKLTAADNAGGSGVAATYYKLDGGAQVTGTSIATTVLGSHTIEFWSADVAGNIETPHKTAAFTITAPVPVDTTAPVTTSDAKATYVSSAAIKLTATDAGSGVAATYYRLDGGAQLTGTVVNVTTVGAHTLQFWSVDMAGNVELFKTAAFTITAPVPVDTTAPATTSDAKATYVSSAAIKLTAADNAGGSGVAATYYKLDGGAQLTGTSIATTVLGSHAIEFWSADLAGNIETPHKTAAFTITAPVPVDTTAPATTSDAKATYVSSAAIKLTAADNAGGSGVAATYYKLDGGTQATGTSISLTTVGSHTLEFWSVDKAGNIETPHKTAAVTITAPVPVDTTAPATTSDAKAQYNFLAAIKLAAKDNVGGSGVAHTYYLLDSAAQAEGTMVSVTTTGTHTLEFWSVDKAGNVESPRTKVSFEVIAPAKPPTVIYRFFRRNGAGHFYTSSPEERDALLGRWRSAYTLDGVAFTINTLNPDNRTPLYRFYNKKNGSHFYTASESEKANVLAKLSGTYSYDGPAYNVCMKPVDGATTVYRFYNKWDGSHFYTASESEKAQVLANLTAKFSLDGPAYYLAP